MGFLDRLFSAFRHPDPADKHHAMTSLVVLSRSREALTVEGLVDRLEALFPGTFRTGDAAGSFVLDGPVQGGSFMIKCLAPRHQGIFMLYTVPAPYDGYSSYRRHISDPELQRRAAEHRCWMSVDAVGAFGGEEDAYRFIGQVLAALAPEDALLLVHPSRMHTVPFDEDLRRQLSLEGFRHSS